MGRAWLFVFLLAPTLAMGQTQSTARIVEVKIEATEPARDILLKKLDKNGKEHHVLFDSARKGFAYRIVFATGQAGSSPRMQGETDSGQASVAVYDSKGSEVFEFQRKSGATDSGTVNAVAKEIIKRLLRRWRLESKDML